MDDQTSQGMPGMSGAVPHPPPPMAGMPPPPPGGPMGAEAPHVKIMAALERIEEKLTSIALKVGAR